MSPDMENSLIIFTEQLRDGKRQDISQTLPSDFLDIKESDLTFHSPIYLKGEVYATDEELIVQMSAHTEVKMPCSICNEMTFVTLKTGDLYHTILFSDLKSTTFDLSDLVREEIILLIPQFVECQNGQCPERTQVARFMKSKAVSSENHFPFADL